MKAKFIVVEGLEGAGKTSVISKISSFLKESGKHVTCTREPGGTPLAEAIRECVKQNWNEEVTIETELLLMYAARSQLVKNVIKPALEKGEWVIGDRHDWSSIAYQGAGRQVGFNKLDKLRTMTLGAFKPDFTFYLDVEPQKGLARARGRGELDRIEQSSLEFFVRARAAFVNLVNNEQDSVLIDANQSMLSVHSSVIEHLKNLVFGRDDG